MIADDAVFEWNAARLRIAECGRCATIGHRHHDIAVAGSFLGQFIPMALRVW